VSGTWAGLREKLPQEDATLELNFRGQVLDPQLYHHLLVHDAIGFAGHPLRQ
jgi:hypothetical protein